MLALFRAILASAIHKQKTTSRFFVVAPIRFPIDVIVCFWRNILQLMVFILPMKIILVIASPELPGILKAVAPSLGREAWLIVLASAVVTFYLLAIFLDIYLERSASRYSRKFAKVHKKERFANHEFLARVYIRLVEARSATFLLLTLGAGVGLLYPDYLIFFIASTLLTAVIVSAICLQFDDFLARFSHDPSKYIGRASGLLFILAFCYIIYDFLDAQSTPELFSVIVAVILSRRLLAAISQKIADLVWFSRKASGIQRLFYRGHSDAAVQQANTGLVVDSLARMGLENFSLSALSSLGFSDVQVRDVRWLETPLSWVSVLDFELSGVSDIPKGRILLKIYEGKRFREAREEMVLYAPLKAAGVMPEFLGEGEVHGFPVHAFILNENWNFTTDQLDSQLIRGKLLNLQIDEETLHDYAAEHPMLHDRITSNLLSRMKLVARDDVSLSYLNRFLEWLPSFKSLLAEMPARLWVPDDITRSLLVMNGDRLQLLGLGEWYIEPLGSGLAIEIGETGKLMPLKSAVKSDGTPVVPEVEHYIVSMIGKVERFVLKKRLVPALTLVNELMAEGSSSVRCLEERVALSEVEED